LSYKGWNGGRTERRMVTQRRRTRLLEEQVLSLREHLAREASVVDGASRQHDALDVVRGEELLVRRRADVAELRRHLLRAPRPRSSHRHEIDPIERERVPGVHDAHPTEPSDADSQTRDLRP